VVPANAGGNRRRADGQSGVRGEGEPKNPPRDPPADPLFHALTQIASACCLRRYAPPLELHSP
jgi:hypothetical protein